MKSKILLLLRYRTVYVALSLLLYILVLELKIALLLVPIYGLYIFKNHRKVILISLLIIVIYSFSLQNINKQKINTATQYKVEVIKDNSEDNKTKFIGSINNKLVSVYLSDRYEIVPGDLYSVKGELVKPSNNTIPGTFNYKNYLLSKKIKYTLFAENMNLIEKKYSSHIISYNIEKYIDQNIPLSKSYVKTFILGDKSDFDQATLNSVNTLGISHLFAVSGLHVGILVMALQTIMKKTKMNNLWVEIIITIVLTIYILITAFAPSITRAALMYIFLVINKRMKFDMSVMDIISIIFIMLLILNPYYYYSIGFVLSFFVTFFLLLSVKILKRYKSIPLLFMVGYIAFLGTFPIVLNLNYKINLLSLLFNVLFIIYMSYVVLPLSYFTFLFPFIDKVLNIVITMYNVLIDTYSQIDYFILTGSFNNAMSIMIYYIFVMFYFIEMSVKRDYKGSIVFVLIIILIAINSKTFDVYQRVSFLDVRGDSTFISDRFNQCNILIDTGDKDDYNSTIMYLKSQNIKEIDYLIISHFHSDHYGEMYDLLENFDISTIITNENSNNYSDSLITCGNLSFFIYDLTYNKINENNNSIILSLFISGKHYLFTGDAETIREKEFVDNYAINVDYLKVGHHGSITSSNEFFIDSVVPSEVFIIVKKNNIHKHPDEVIINRYLTRGIIVNRTDVHGTIEVVYLFGNETKKYYMP